MKASVVFNTFAVMLIVSFSSVARSQTVLTYSCLPDTCFVADPGPTKVGTASVSMGGLCSNGQALPSSQTKAVYGNGITGDVSANPTYDLDCDGDPNDNLAAQNPEIEATDQVQEEDGSIIFNFQITNFQYTGTGCDACDSNPSGYYPVSSESYNSSPFLQAYCGTTN